MDEKQEIAIDAYKSGCNCAQSTISALCEELGLTEEQTRRLMGGFGGGFDGMQEVCGAFSCVCTAIGYLYTEILRITMSQPKTIFFPRYKKLLKNLKKKMVLSSA